MCCTVVQEQNKNTAWLKKIFSNTSLAWGGGGGEILQKTERLCIKKSVSLLYFEKKYAGSVIQWNWK